MAGNWTMEGFEAQKDMPKPANTLLGRSLSVHFKLNVAVSKEWELFLGVLVMRIIIYLLILLPPVYGSSAYDFNKRHGQPWSKLLIRGFYRDHIECFLQGYQALCKKF